MTTQQEFNSAWENAIDTLFPSRDWNSTEWNHIDEIVRVLKTIAESPNSNHLFFPVSGGMDLLGASRSREPECIELLFGKRSASIVKPRLLKFEAVRGDFQASYFRLLCNRLTPTDLYDKPSRYEELLEIGSEYLDRSIWDRGFLRYDADENEVPIPPSARVVTRHIDPGSYVIFSKGSQYNADSATYDGRHDKLSELDFRQLVEKQYRS